MKKYVISISFLLLLPVIAMAYESMPVVIDKDGVFVGDGIVVGSATATVIISSPNVLGGGMDNKDSGLKNYGPFNVFIGSHTGITTSTATTTVGTTFNSYCLEVGEWISIGGINHGPVYGKQAPGNVNSIIYRTYIDLNKKR